jgi:hypothetical protein
VSVEDCTTQTIASDTFTAPIAALDSRRHNALSGGGNDEDDKKNNSFTSSSAIPHRANERSGKISDDSTCQTSTQHVISRQAANFRLDFDTLNVFGGMLILMSEFAHRYMMTHIHGSPQSAFGFADGPFNRAQKMIEGVRRNICSGHIFLHTPPSFTPRNRNYRHVCVPTYRDAACVQFTFRAMCMFTSQHTFRVCSLCSIKVVVTNRSCRVLPLDEVHFFSGFAICTL